MDRDTLVLAAVTGNIATYFALMGHLWGMWTVIPVLVATAVVTVAIIFREARKSRQHDTHERNPP